MNYYEKYLKYKNKYNILKKYSGGANGTNSESSFSYDYTNGPKISNTKYNNEYKNNNMFENEDTDIEGTIIKISYCSFAILVTNSINQNKVIYVSRFPPHVNSTNTFPNKSNNTNVEDFKNDNISKGQFISFWFDSRNTQDTLNTQDIKWKGGAWGSDNLITTSDNWFTGAFIGDQIKLKYICDGVKDKINVIIEDTKYVTTTCDGKIIKLNNISYESKAYKCYVTDNAVDQVATDALVVLKLNTGEKYIRLLQRANGPTTDMPYKYIPGAGEHLELMDNTTFMLDYDKTKWEKSGVGRSLKEEMGIEYGNIASSNDFDVYLIPLGKFDEKGRDPRYGTYEWNEITKNSNNKYETIHHNFGINRKSSTTATLVYIMQKHNNNNVDLLNNFLSFQNANTDQQEISKSEWVLLCDNNYTVSEDLKNKYKDFMIKDHKKIIDTAIKHLSVFDDNNYNVIIKTGTTNTTDTTDATDATDAKYKTYTKEKLKLNFK